MPKMKTKRGAAKRFKVTGSGRSSAAARYRRHILTTKSRKREAPTAPRRHGRPGEREGGEEPVSVFVKDDYGFRKDVEKSFCGSRSRASERTPMPRVKRGTKLTPPPQEAPEARQGSDRRPQELSPGALDGREGARLRVPRPQGPQARLSQPVDRAHQRRRAAERHHLPKPDVCGLKKAGVEVDRKVLADLAVKDPAAFSDIAALAKSKIAA